MALPGFEYADYDGPALPLALYELGQDNPHRGGGPAAPLALRLFVEAVRLEALVEQQWEWLRLSDGRLQLVPYKGRPQKIALQAAQG